MDKMALSIEICPFWFLITSAKLPRRFLRLSGKMYLISEGQLPIHVFLHALFEMVDLEPS